jgi:hypothetical protein
MVVKTLRNGIRIIRFSVVMAADPVGRSEMIDKVRSGPEFWLTPSDNLYESFSPFRTFSCMNL